MLPSSTNGHFDGVSTDGQDYKKDIAQSIFDFAGFAEGSGIIGDDGLSNGIYQFGYNGDTLSPPSPATIASTTDLSGGDYLPPETASSQRSSLSNNDFEPSAYNHGHRARSVSQPTSFVQRKTNLSLQIPHNPPPPFPTQQHQHHQQQSQPQSQPQQQQPHQTQHYPSYDNSTSYHVNPMTGFYPDSPAHQMGAQDYFNMPFSSDGDVMMSSTNGDHDQTIQGTNATLVKPWMDNKYGYRLPISQPSSPVRSGYPPGQAPYAGHHFSQGRPRGFTTSDVQGHALLANMSGYRTAMPQHQQHQQPQSQQQPPPPQQMHVQSTPQTNPNQPPASPYGYSPVEPTGYGMPHPLSNVGTPQSAQIVALSGMSNGTHSPFQNTMNMHGSQQSPISPPPNGQQTFIDEAVARMQDPNNVNQAGINVNYNQPTPVNFRLAEPVSKNPVPHLENQAMSYSVGTQDMQMEPQAMSLSASQASFAPSGAGSKQGSGSRMEDMITEPQARSLILESRRSSTSTGPALAGLSTPGPAQKPAGYAVNNGSMTPDISKQVQEKLTFLDNLANSVAQARQEILLGHANAADEYITDVGNAIIEKALSPENIANPTPSLNLTLPGLGSIVQASQAPSLAPSPSISLAMTPVNNISNSDGMSQQPALAPPFELKRSRSVKRSAPESPLLTSSAMNNKHIKLGEVNNAEIVSAPVSAGPATPIPGLVHSHSFPEGPLPTLVNHPGLMNLPIAPASPINTNLLSAQAVSRPPTVPSPLGDPAGPMIMDNSFSAEQIAEFMNTPINTPQPGWHYGMAPASELVMASQIEPFSQNANMPVIQQTTPSRRGSIVDGRLISHRPNLGMLGTGVDGKTMSTPVVPTMASSGQHNMSATLAMTSTHQGQNPAHGRSGTSQPPSGPNGFGNFTGAGGDGVLAGGDGFGGDSDSDSDDDGPRKLKRRRSSEAVTAPPGTLIQPPDLISAEMRAQLDKILFDFLNRVCSDLEYHDAKGELLHQALMPKKMAKLDESPDFRPFKFRIQAFTNAFAEELQRLGVLEETLSAKKIKSYLWNQKLISRFNDDGKKSKSKGNHIWNVDAKKMSDGTWIFREFKRKIAPPPPTRAFLGAMFSWTPRVWDPQASTADLKVSFSSPPGTLPRWLTWQDNVLTGTPTDSDTHTTVTAIANFLDSANIEHQLSLTFPIHLTRVGDDSSTVFPTGPSYISVLPPQSTASQDTSMTGFSDHSSMNVASNWPAHEFPQSNPNVFRPTSPRPQQISHSSQVFAAYSNVPTVQGSHSQFQSDAGPSHQT